MAGRAICPMRRSWRGFGVEFGEGGEMITIVDIQRAKKDVYIMVTDMLGEEMSSVWEG
jgi:hypothetical protein